MSQDCVEISSLVRLIVLDTLKSSAPGIAEQMRWAIANSVAMKIHAQLVPQPTITPALDAAVQDEIEHGPKDIMTEPDQSQGRVALGPNPSQPKNIMK